MSDTILPPGASLPLPSADPPPLQTPTDSAPVTGTDLPLQPLDPSAPLLTPPMPPSSIASASFVSVPTTILDPSVVYTTIVANTSVASATASSTDVPVIASSSSTHHHVGAIAGGVVGGLAVLAALVGCLLYYRYRRTLAHPVRRLGRNPSFGGSHPKYDAYAVENGAGLGAIPVSKKLPSRHSSTGSAATMVNGRDSIKHGRSLSIPGLSYEDFSTEDDKSFFTPSHHGHKALDLTEDAPPLPALDFIPAAPTDIALPDGRTRTRSLTSQNRAAALAKLDASDSPSAWSQNGPRSPDSLSSALRRQSLDARLLSSPPQSPGSVSPSSMEMSRMNRTSLKRATRKAVPKYDETEFSPSGSSTPPPELENGGADLSSPSLHTAKSKEDLVAAGLAVPELSHKSSFGEAKAIHYLIPDPPPAQKD